jgi:hypothetical protein
MLSTYAIGPLLNATPTLVVACKTARVSISDNITKKLFAAVRTIRWVPGKCHGKNVPMLYVLPITIDYGAVH